MSVRKSETGAEAMPGGQCGGIDLRLANNYYGQGTGQGYAIDNLAFSASVLPSNLITPITISPGSVQVTGSGDSAAASFSFTNGIGLTFKVRGTNDVTAPRSTWPVIGTATDTGTPGHYLFTDPAPAINDSSFYMLSFP